MDNLKTILRATCIAAALGVTGCAVQPGYYSGNGYGPPPHAPAHGYRYKYQERNLVYDRNLGVYLVSGYPGYYFLDNSYYRHGNDGWYHSQEFDRDWQQYPQGNLPPGLARKYQDSGSKHGSGGKKDRDDEHGHSGYSDREGDYDGNRD